MSELKVKILEHTPNPERVVAAAAKLCYSQVGVDEISGNLTDESVDKFLSMLVGLGHGSPFEHVSFTFAVEGVSRSLTHQLVRHRVASYSQQSQRYVKLAQFEYIVPPAIEQDEEAKQVFISAMEEDQIAYDKLVAILQDNAYNKMVNKYIEEHDEINNIGDMEVGILSKYWKDAEKIAIEDARYVFPNACETKIVFTMNARELMHFFSHRACNRAQWEIREMSAEMIKLLREIAPTIFKFSGPGCINGPCPEGKMTCGKIQEVRERFKAL